MSAKFFMNKSDLNFYLNELAKEIKKSYGRNFETEIIIVGGGAIMTNYSFREMTADIDAIIRANARIKDVIYKIADKYNLPNDWLNSDFMSTESYSPQLIEVSKYYRSFGNGALSVRTIDAEYLIAMKLRSFRPYKKDLSDIVGLIMEHKINGYPLSEETIVSAYEKLYNCALPDKVSEFLKEVLATENLETLYSKVITQEESNKERLVSFEKKYPEVLSENNLEDILAKLQSEIDETPETTDNTKDSENKGGNGSLVYDEIGNNPSLLGTVVDGDDDPGPTPNKDKADI